MRLNKMSSLICAFVLTPALLVGCSSATPPPAAMNQPVKQEPAKPATPAVTPPALAAAAPSGDAKETPRNETLYINGLQWGRQPTSIY